MEDGFFGRSMFQDLLGVCMLIVFALKVCFGCRSSSCICLFLWDEFYEILVELTGLVGV